MKKHLKYFQNLILWRKYSMDNFSEALQQLMYDFLAFLPDFATALIVFSAASTWRG
jgi:hypothetical protein